MTFTLINWKQIRQDIAEISGYKPGMEITDGLVEKIINAEMSVIEPLGLIDQNGQQSFETAINCDLLLTDEQRRELLEAKD